MIHSLPLFAAAGTAEAPNAVTAITQQFGISVPFLLAQIVNFCVVAFILWKFAFKPVIATLDERQRKIASGLQYADEMKAKLDATQQETAAILRKAQTDASRIIDEARKSAKDYLDKQMVESAAKANEVAQKAQQAIELEHKKMLADARSEIARLVVATTQRVLSKDLSDADRNRYAESAARELTGV